MSAPDALDLVSGNGDTNAGGTDHNAPLTLALRHGPGGCGAEVRVVTALRGVAAKVLIGVPQPLQNPFDKFLQFIAAMVAAQRNLHISTPLRV